MPWAQCPLFRRAVWDGPRSRAEAVEACTASVFWVSGLFGFCLLGVKGVTRIVLRAYASTTSPEISAEGE